MTQKRKRKQDKQKQPQEQKQKQEQTPKTQLHNKQSRKRKRKQKTQQPIREQQPVVVVTSMGQAEQAAGSNADAIAGSSSMVDVGMQDDAGGGTTSLENPGGVWGEGRLVS